MAQALDSTTQHSSFTVCSVVASSNSSQMFSMLRWWRLAAGVAAVVLRFAAVLVCQAALARDIFGSHTVLILLRIPWWIIHASSLPPSTHLLLLSYTPPLLFLTFLSLFICTFLSPACLPLTPVFLCIHIFVHSLVYILHVANQSLYWFIDCLSYVKCLESFYFYLKSIFKLINSCHTSCSWLLVRFFWLTQVW